LKTTQRAILAQIGRSEPTTVGELAEALVMDSGALKPLERDGLIAVAVDPPMSRLETGARQTNRFHRCLLHLRASGSDGLQGALGLDG
jgi:hypothetical protein